MSGYGKKSANMILSILKSSMKKLPILLATII